MRFHVIVACVFAAASWGMLLGQESPKSEDKPEEPKREAKKDQDEPAENSLAADYGFLPVEVFKLSPRIHNLTARDLNGDGCKDLVVVENGASRINILFARGQMPAEEREKLEVNELRSTWRFDQHKIPVTRKIDALVTGDFNGDGVADLCYIGDNHLHLAKGEKEKGGKGVKWSQPSEKRLTDQALPFNWRIAAADLDADGCDDLTILGDTELLIVRGNKASDLEKIERVANTSNKMNFLWVRDFDGDARPDIVMLSDEDPERSLVVRFQNSKGSFGPEIRFETPMPRAFDLAELDGKPGQEFLSIDAKTNRLKFFRCDMTPEQSDEPTSPIVQFGFGPRTSKAGTLHVAPGDVNGDGRLDVVVVDGDAALMSVYLQDPKTGLGQAQQFPGLTGVRAIVLADIDGDKQAELLLASEREKVIGISKWRDGRMTFPEALPNVSDTPLALCLADFDGRGKRDIAYVASSRGSGGTSYTLRKLSHTPDMGWNHGEFGGMDAVPLDKLRSAPAEMLAVDADRDGRSDLMLLANNAPLTFLATDARGVPQVVDTGASSRLGNVSPGKVTVGELDGQAILITDKNFTRRVRLDAKGQWNVVDQYNAESFDAAITGSALIDLDGDGKREIVLVDVGTHRLRFLKQQNGVYRPWKDLPTGALNVQAVYVGDFNGDGREDLLMAGPDRFGIAYTGLPGSRVELIGSFETQIKDSKPSDLVVGDLGGGKELDIAVIDHQQHRVEIITPRDGDWKSALTFKVFEASERSGAGAEPRELAVGDVTGDGLDDLIMIVHDRVLLYPQDGGK